MHYNTTVELLMNIRKDIKKHKEQCKNSVANAYLDEACCYIASTIFQLSQAQEFEKGTWELKLWHKLK